jgi:O-antigen/teichoic acid export membrane protein
MKKKGSVLNSSSWTLGVKFIERGVSLIIYIMLARFLSIEEFGVVAFAMLFLEFITVIISSGVKDFILTRKEVNKIFIDTCTFSVVTVSILVSILFYLVMDLFFIDKSELMQDVFKVLLLLPAISSFNIVQTALLQRNFNFKSLSLRNLFSTLVAGAISVYCAFDGYGAWALVINQYCKVIVDTIILQVIVKYKPGLSLSYTYFKECYRFSIPLLVSEVMNFWSTRMMDLFVSIIHGVGSLAVLNISRKFTRLVQQLSLTSLRPVVLSYATKSEDKSEAFAKFISYITFVVAPILIAIGVYAEFYVTPIFGEQWEPAIVIIEILSFTAVAQCLSWYFGLVLITQGKNVLLFKLNVVFTLIFFLAGLFSYRLQFTEYIIVQTFVINMVSIYKIYFLIKNKYMGYHDFKSYIVPSVISCLIFVFTSLVFRNFLNSDFFDSPWVKLSLTMLFSTFSFLISFFITMLFFSVFSKDIKESFFRVTSKRRKGKA